MNLFGFRSRKHARSCLRIRRLSWPNREFAIAGLTILLVVCSIESHLSAERKNRHTSDPRSNALGTVEESPSDDLPKDNLPVQWDWKEAPLGLPRNVPVPDDSPLTDETVALGRRLFFDPSLSRDRTVSCASCHRPENAFASPDRVAIGIDNQAGLRNSPSLLNVAYGKSFFWDGRAATLEEQALQPIESAEEMGFTVEGVLERLGEDETYRREFERAFVDGLNRSNLAKALASFQRSLLSANSDVDRFRAGDFSALTDDERKGMWLFESRGGCWRCHNGPNFGDDQFHNTGVSWGAETGDTGRHMRTGEASDLGKFKTPGLRQVALTAPYMHDGSLETLEDVVRYYNKGGEPNDNLDAVLKPLELSEAEIGFLVSFLHALTADAPGHIAESTDE